MQSKNIISHTSKSKSVPRKYKPNTFLSQEEFLELKKLLSKIRSLKGVSQNTIINVDFDESTGQYLLVVDGFYHSDTVTVLEK